MKKLSLFIEPKSTGFSNVSSSISLLSDKHITDVATQHKALIRTRKFNYPKYILNVLACMNSATKGSEFRLSKINETYNSSVDEANRLDPKCIHNKIRSDKFLNTVQTLLSELLYFTNTNSFMTKIRNSVPEYSSQLMKKLDVKDIILIDGTEIDVTYSCADNFTCKGKGRPKNDGTPARPGIKLHVAYSLFKQTIEFVEITEAVGNEKACVHPERFHNCLIIADRGYISEELEKSLAENNNYFIIKGKSNTAGSITSAKDLQGNSLPEYLGKKVSNLPDNVNADLSVSSASGHNFRVVHHVNPLKDTNEDKDSFSNLRTNIPENVMNAEQIYLLYRIRWQIELFNKANKSGNCLQSINSADYNIVLSFILLSLILSTLKSIYGVEAMSLLKEKQDITQEISSETMSTDDENENDNTDNSQVDKNSSKNSFLSRTLSLLKLHCKHSVFEKFFSCLMKNKLATIYENVKELCRNIIRYCLRTSPSVRDRDSYRDLPTLIQKILDLSNDGGKIS